MLFFIERFTSQRIAKSLKRILTGYRNGLIVGVDCIKCEYLRVTNKSLPLPTQYYINNPMIRQVPHAK